MDEYLLIRGFRLLSARVSFIVGCFFALYPLPLPLLLLQSHSLSLLLLSPLLISKLFAAPLYRCCFCKQVDKENKMFIMFYLTKVAKCGPVKSLHSPATNNDIHNRTLCLPAPRRSCIRPDSCVFTALVLFLD